MPQLRCVSAYTADDVRYAIGAIVEGDEAELARLLRDSPGSFEPVRGSEVRVGGPDEFIGYDAPARSTEPVRGQEPLQPGSVVATPRRADRVTGEVFDATPASGPPPQAEFLPEAEGEIVDYEDLTIADLRALAADRGIDLGAARTKRDIIAAIEGGSIERTLRGDDDSEDD